MSFYVIREHWLLFDGHTRIACLEFDNGDFEIMPKDHDEFGYLRGSYDFELSEQQIEDLDNIFYDIAGDPILADAIKPSMRSNFLRLVMTDRQLAYFKLKFIQQTHHWKKSP